MQPINQVILQIIPNMTFLRREICEGCGCEVEIFEYIMPFGPQKGQKKISKKGCECRLRQMDEELMRVNAQAKLNYLQKNFDRHSLINEKLQGASFENYIPKNESQNMAKKIAMRYVEVFDKGEPRNLLFTGSYGTGKSHLAKSVTDEIIKKGFSAIFISVPKLLTKFRSTYADDAEQTEDELVNALNQVDVLVLDDLGAEKHSEWSWEKLFEIVDTRQGKHTIYTTNLSPKDLIAKLGERNFSRIVNEDTIIIEVSGENHRLRKFG